MIENIVLYADMQFYNCLYFEWKKLTPFPVISAKILRQEDRFGDFLTRTCSAILLLNISEQ